MKKRIAEALSHPLVSGSTIILIGSFSANILNYFYNLVMGRMLSPQDYGVLAALISIVNILSVIALTITTVFTKFSASFIAQGKEVAIGFLLKRGTLWVGILSTIMFGVMSIYSFEILQFLHIKSQLLLYITAGILFITLIFAVPIGILQGLLKFFSFSFINIVSSLIKLGLGALFVYMGFRVAGALNAFFISSIVGYLLTFPILYKFLRNKNDPKLETRDIRNKLIWYGIPVFLSSLGMTALISLDIILVKHFFQALVAGQYAALSLMGRSIFYLTSPITFVFFPLIAQKKERGEKLLGTLLLSILMIGGASLILSIIYFTFPKLVLTIFFPAEEYVSLSPYLGPFSVFILLYSLCWLFNSFYLAIGKTRVLFLTGIASIIEILYIFIFHENIMQVVTGLIVISIVLLLGFILYYPFTVSKLHSSR